MLVLWRCLHLAPVYHLASKSTRKHVFTKVSRPLFLYYAPHGLLGNQTSISLAEYQLGLSVRMASFHSYGLKAYEGPTRLLATCYINVLGHGMGNGTGVETILFLFADSLNIHHEGLDTVKELLLEVSIP